MRDYSLFQESIRTIDRLIEGYSIPRLRWDDYVGLTVGVVLPLLFFVFYGWVWVLPVTAVLGYGWARTAGCSDYALDVLAKYDGHD